MVVIFVWSYRCCIMNNCLVIRENKQDSATPSLLDVVGRDGIVFFLLLRVPFLITTNV